MVIERKLAGVVKPRRPIALGTIWWPLLLGVGIALIAGLLTAFHSIATQDYLRFHLFHTSLSILIRAMDRYALGASGILLVVTMALRIGRRWWQRLYAVQTWEERPHPIRSSLSAVARTLANALYAVLALLAICFLVVNLATVLLWAHNAIILTNRPNVIFIMVDTLRADHLGCYGYDLPVSPAIDRLAREGIRFRHARAQSSWTVWSVSSLLTSRYPDLLYPNDSMGMGADGLGIDYYYPTLAEVLKEQGYTTNAVVSNVWLEGRDAPTNRQGYDYYDDSPSRYDGKTGQFQMSYAQQAASYQTKTLISKDCGRVVTDRAIQQLDALRNRKFFMFLLYFDPHEPYCDNAGFTYPESEHDRAIARRLSHAWTPAMAAERRQYLRQYNSEIGFTDAQIGRFLAELQRRGLYKNSLIVFFSDHGEEFLEHRSFGHLHTLYEEVVQVPLIIRFPDQTQGRVIDGSFPLIDLTPSLLQYLGIDHSALGYQGTTVNIPTLQRCIDKPIYSSTIGRLSSVTNGQYKYVRRLIRIHELRHFPSPNQALTDSAHRHQKISSTRNDVQERYEEHCYNLADDPLEQVDLVKKDWHVPSMLQTFLAQRDAHILPADIQHLQEAAPDENIGKLDTLPKDVLNRLRTLGYLQ